MTTVLVSLLVMSGQAQQAAAPPAKAADHPLKPLTTIPGITAVLPTASERKPQVILFLAAPSVAGDPFERQLGTKDAMAKLADELGAALLFAAPPVAGANGTPDTRQLQADLRKAVVPSILNRYGLTVVGVGAGAPAALLLFTRDASLADTLVLVNPDPLPDAALSEMSSAPADARPCVLLASTAAAKGAASIKAALTKRNEKVDVVEASLTDGSAVPLAHVATAMKWTVPAAVLRRGQPLIGTAPVPALGQPRIDTLKSLLELQAVAAQVAAPFDGSVNLKEMPAAPAVAKTDPFVTTVENRYQQLDAVAKDMSAKAAQKLEAAKDAAAKQVPALTAKLSRTPVAQREAVRQKFLDENFPWPDLVPPLEPPVTEEQFMAVIKSKCARCHPKATPSVQSLIAARWLVPGKPNQSTTYTVIGVHKRPGGTYHNLSDADKKIVRDFIEQMPAK